jgi:VanZ family protein
MKRLLPYLFWLWIFVIAWLAFRAGTPGPGPGSEKYFFSIRLDYWKHLGAFGLLALAYFGTRPRLFHEKRYKHVFGWLVMFSLYGMGIEVMQFYIPGRAFNPLDMLFNVLGLLGGVIACYLYYRCLAGQVFPCTKNP